MRYKKIGIAGTHGVPAKYGGFETLAENLVNGLKNDYLITVYCNSKIYNEHERNITGFFTKYINLSASGWQSLFYDLISLTHAFFTQDVIIYLGPTSGYLLLLNLFSKKVIVNYGGLNEWERPKYKKYEKWFFKQNISISAKLSKYNIVDNNVLKASLNKTFNCSSYTIRYGGDHVYYQNNLNVEDYIDQYPYLNDDYFLVVARAQVDSMLDLVITSFMNSDKKLVIISNWDISNYGINLKSNSYPNNIILEDAIYDKPLLNLIRSNTSCYIHSHSFCGTAPSLVEAMTLGVPIICYDVPTNRETTLMKSLYFSSSEELTKLTESLSKADRINLAKEMASIAKENYTWEKIIKSYKILIDL